MLTFALERVCAAAAAEPNSLESSLASTTISLITAFPAVSFSLNAVSFCRSVSISFDNADIPAFSSLVGSFFETRSIASAYLLAC